MSSARGGGARTRGRGVPNGPRGVPRSRSRVAGGTPSIRGGKSTITDVPTTSTGQRRGSQNVSKSAHGGFQSTTPLAGKSRSLESWQTRYTNLTKSRERERKDAIRRGVIADPDKPRSLSDAVTLVGTCQDMCAEFERAQRVVQRDVWPEEKVVQHSEYSGSERDVDESRMVKKFRRAAAGLEEQLPSDLRPPKVLKRTCDYLFNEVIGDAPSLGSVHHFVWDRTRAIRNDFSIQQVTKEEDLRLAIDCYERITRFHIMSLHQLAGGDRPYHAYDPQQEREQLDRTILSLLQYYGDCRGRFNPPNEAEFRAYSIIFQLQDPTPDMEDRVQGWPWHIIQDPRVSTALDLFVAASNTTDAQGPLKPRARHLTAQQDWERFWVLTASKRVSYLMACMAEIYFNLIRRTVLNALWRAFRGNPRVPDEHWTPSTLADMFAYDTEDELYRFCESYGFSFRDRSDGDGQFLDLTSVRDKELPMPDKTLPAQVKCSLVEDKRMGRPFPAIINGMSVRQAQDAGMIIEEGMEQDSTTASAISFSLDGQEDPSPGTYSTLESPLFVPQSAPAKTSAFNTFGTSPFAPQSGFGQPSTSGSATPTGFGRPSTTGGLVGPFAPKDDNTTPVISFGKSSSNPFATTSNLTQQSTTETAKDMPPAFSWTTTPSATTASTTPSLTPSQRDAFATAPAKSSPFATAGAASPFASIPSSNANATPANLTSFSLNKDSQGNSANLKPDALPTFSPSTFGFAKPDEKEKATSSQPTTSLFPSKPTSFGAKGENPFATALLASSNPLFAFGSTTPETITAGSDSPFSQTSKPPASSSLGFDFLGKSTNEDSKSTSATTSVDQTETAKLGKDIAAVDPGWTFNVNGGNGTSNINQPSFSSLSQSKQASSTATNSGQSAEKSSPANAAAPPSNFTSTTLRKPSFTQDTRPKKPSPLAHSFSAEEAPVIADGDASRMIKQGQFASNPPADARERPTFPSILDRLSKEVIHADRWGLLDQYVDYEVGRIITNVQDMLYIEQINAEATEFRQFVLSYRYGLRWKEIYWRRRRARQGRKRRERARQSLMESKMSTADQARASRRGSHIGSSNGNYQSATHNQDSIDQLFQQTMRDSRASSVASSVQQALLPQRSIQINTATPLHRRQDHVDRHGRITKPRQHSPAPAANGREQLNRSAYLGFSLPMDAPNRASTTQTNYFRLKALGIGTSSSTVVPGKGAKRARTSSIGAVSDMSPPSTKRLTVPSSSPDQRIAIPVPGPESKASKAYQEDEALFARLKAAREGLDEASRFMKDATSKQSGSPQSIDSAPLSFGESPSLIRARSEARLAQTQNQYFANQSTEVDVPAYRLRESRFVPRDQYSKAIERANDIRAARSRETSVLDTPLDAKLNSQLTASQLPSVPLQSGTAINDHELGLVEKPAFQTHTPFTAYSSTPTFGKTSLGHTDNIVNNAFSFAAINPEPNEPRDLTVKPEQLQESLRASFGSAGIDSNAKPVTPVKHDAFEGETKSLSLSKASPSNFRSMADSDKWTFPQQNLNDVRSRHDLTSVYKVNGIHKINDEAAEDVHSGTQFEDEPMHAHGISERGSEDNLDGTGPESAHYEDENEDESEDEDAVMNYHKSSFAHANAFAALVDGNDESEVESDAEEFDDEAEEEASLNDVDNGIDYREEDDRGSEADEDEESKEEGHDSEEDEDEDDMSEEDERQYLDPRLAASTTTWNDQEMTQNDMSQHIGGTEDDAIELSD